MILMFLANGFEEIEALTPLDCLRRVGEDVVTVGIGGREITGSHGITVLADTDDAHLPSVAPDMVILPGGMPGSATLDASPVVDKVLSEASARGAYLAAICAAPMVLGKRGYLEGKHATCYPGFEEHLHGATVRHDAGVVQDGNVITAAGMGVALDFALTLVSELQGSDTAANLRASLQAPGK
jgi:4-methyl-5(b-hydroxyethyl)-thiazole monophosphate biosynthesis